jgi:hypothetical protein
MVWDLAISEFCPWGSFMHFSLRVISLAVLGWIPLAVSAQGLDTAKIDAVLGRPGQKSGEVYRVGFPRTDLRVLVQGIAIQPGLALGSWAAFTGSDDQASVMGDLVLLPGELNPVMVKLRGAGFEITAVHNHLLDESPRVIYVHYMGHGPAAQLAAALRSALAASNTPLGAPPAAAAGTPIPPRWVKTTEDALGRKGTFKGGVLSFGVPRAEPISMDGMSLTPASGVAQSINFQEAGNGTVATTGDFVLLASEVNSVISVLEEHHISVTALHSHMLTDQPRLFFMHFWAVGTPESVAKGIRAALSQVAIQKQSGNHPAGPSAGPESRRTQ